MKKLLSLFSCLAVLFIYAPSVKAATIDYCSEFSSPGVCATEESNLTDFLEALADDNDFFPDGSMSVEEDYLIFGTHNFTYYTPLWIIEDSFDSDTYEDEYFSANDWGDTDDNSNLIPDVLEDYADEFERNYNSFTGTYKLDLWWDESNPLPVVYDDLGSGYYGYFSWGETDADAYMMVNYFEDEDAIVGTISHELFHAVQYGYVEDMSILSENSFAEGTATMMESKLNGNSDLSYMQLEDIAALDYPERSIFGALTAWNDTDKYGSFLWYSFLHQYYGKSIVKGMLEAFAELGTFDEDAAAYYSYLAVSQALAEQGEDIAEVYGEFAIKNYEQDDYTDGEYLPEVKILESYSSNSGEGSVEGEDAPALFGSNYIEFETEGDEGYLHVNFAGHEDGLFYVSFIPTGKDGSVDHEAIERYWVDYGGEEVEFYMLLDDYDEVIMVVSPVDDNNISTADPFNDYVYPYTYSFDHTDSAPDYTGTSFYDVSNSNPNADAIAYLEENGIVDGYPDGSFKPNNSLNRAELLKILVEGMGYSPDADAYKNCFPDVTTDWYAKYTCFAKEQGWVEGYPDGYFKPANEVNKVEAVKMLLEVFDVDMLTAGTAPYSDVELGQWFTNYIYTADELGLLEENGSLYEPADSITRGGVSENIYRLLIQL